jgi:16S rRNA (guanine966-N2)-methyltransferase
LPLSVIGGEARGRKLRSPRGAVRPTSALLRRSLFDILGPNIAGAGVLDLFAGAGTLGLEALSRGAGAAVFVDQDRECAAVIRANLGLIGATARGRVYCGAVETWLEREAADLAHFDLILLDPPYGDPSLATALEIMGRENALTPRTLVVVEGRATHKVEGVGALEEVRRVRHGDSALTMMRVGG